MNPRAVAAWAGAALAMVVLTNNPVYRGLIALAALNLLVARRRPGTSLRGLVAILVVFGAITVAYNPLISHAGTHHLAHIPEALPGIGGPVTEESIAFGFSAAIGFLAAALAVAPLYIVLDPTDLLDVLPPGLHGTGTAIAAALNLVPAVARTYTRVREAEILRGSSRHGLRALVAVVVPVALGTIESSITLGEAMEARAYGSGPRTRYRIRSATGRDVPVMLLAAAAALTLLGARVAGVDLDWYPFPSLTLPAVSPVAVASCVLLALALAWLRPRPEPGR